MLEVKDIFRSNKWQWAGNTIALIIILAMTLLPVIATFSRIFNLHGIPASQVIVQHMTLWIGFVGAILAAQQNKLLALTYKPLFVTSEKFDLSRFIAKTVSLLVLIALAWGSYQLIKVEYEYPFQIAPHIDRCFAQIIMLVGFIFIAF